MSYLGQYLAGLARMIRADEAGGLPHEEDQRLDDQLHQLWMKLSPQERAQARDWYDTKKKS
jgi:hypothetical protein